MKLIFRIRWHLVFLLVVVVAESCQKEENYDDKIAEVTTYQIINIVELTAEVGGAFLTGLNTEILAYGVCFNTQGNPTVNDSIAEGMKVSVNKIDNRREEKFSCQLSGLLPNSTYYVKAFAINSVGIGYGEEASFDTPPLSVGQSYGGGLIFYVDENNGGGLIAATDDQSANTKWFNGKNYIITGATDVGIGSGMQNTVTIVNKQGEGSYAAKICFDLELNGFDDWFLPSKNELNLMFQQKDLIGGFSNDFYWSSSEHGEGSAWEQVFNTGIQYYANKNSHIHVRAIRAF